MQERIAEVHKETDVHRKKLHQGIAEAAKNQQHDVVRKLHDQMEKLNADSAAAHQKLHMALGEKIKEQHAQRQGDYERQFAEHQQRFAAEREKLEAHRQMLDEQRATNRRAASPTHQQDERSARGREAGDNPKVELEFQNTEKLANPKNVELEFEDRQKAGEPKERGD